METLNNLLKSFERRQVYGYKRDGNTVVAHRWNVARLTDNIYLQEPWTDAYGQRFAHVVLVRPDSKIGLDVWCIGDYQLQNYGLDFLTDRIGFSTVEEFNAQMNAVIENGEYIRNSYIAFVQQYDSALAKRMEVCKADYLERREKREAERRAEYLRKQEQQRREREKEIADEIAQAEQAIINGGRIENTVIDGKCLFLRLFDKHGVNVAIRSRGWIIDKLTSVIQGADGGAQLTYRKNSKYEKVSNGFCAAYWELREILLKEQETVKESPAVDTVPAPAQDVPAVNEAFAPGSQAANALSAPVQAAHDTAAREARQIVAAINPDLLRLFCGFAWHGSTADKNGLNRTKTDGSGFSASWTVDGKKINNTS